MNETRAPIITGMHNVEFIECLVRNEVEFLVVGGAAVLHYECREGGVSEIDIMLENSTENSKKVIKALSQLSITPNFTSHDLEKSKQQIPIKNKGLGYYLDLLTPPKQFSYPDLRKRAEVGILGSVKIPIVGKADLISLKEYAVFALEAETDKHRKDLTCLKAR